MMQTDSEILNMFDTFGKPVYLYIRNTEFHFIT